MHTSSGVLALVFEPNLVRLALLTRRGGMSSEQRAKIRIGCGSMGKAAQQPQAAPPSAGDSDGRPTTDSRVAVAGALDVVGRRLAWCTRTRPRADGADQSQKDRSPPHPGTEERRGRPCRRGGRAGRRRAPISIMHSKAAASRRTEQKDRPPPAGNAIGT